MDIKLKISELAEELHSLPEEMYVVIGVTKSDFMNALNDKEAKTNDKIEAFFKDREYAFSIYDPQQTELIKEFERTILKSGSQANASKLVGLSAGTMSGLRRGKYKGSKSEAFEKLKGYYGAKKQKKQIDVFVPVDYAPTTISQMIYERLRNTHILGGCAVITGDAGIGKTKTIQKYSKDNRAETIVITASVYYHTAKDVLYLLAEELGINDTNMQRIKKGIFSRLHDGMIIIVDEAQELTYQATDALRSIPDYFEGKGETMGLVFVGNPCFYNKFNGRYTSDRVQVSSRFISEPTYTADQIQFEDTKLLYPQLEQKNMTAELIFLHSIATTPSLGQRKALHIFKKAYNQGKYDLNSLVKEAKEAKAKFNNLNEIINKVKELAG